MQIPQELEKTAECATQIAHLHNLHNLRNFQNLQTILRNAHLWYFTSSGKIVTCYFGTGGKVAFPVPK